MSDTTETTTPVPTPETDAWGSAHHIEERAVVYLHLVDGKWEVDSPSNDGYPLEGYDDGALHEECPCMYLEPRNDALIDEGNALARKYQDLPDGPTLPELHRLIGAYLDQPFH